MQNARDVVELLLEHRADPDLLCNGQSPLSLAIASGNDPAIDELLAFGADPNLPLTHGVGSALCAATSPEHEHRRSAKQRVQLVSVAHFGFVLRVRNLSGCLLRKTKDVD